VDQSALVGAGRQLKAVSDAFYKYGS
jgi:hypothetical protein